MSKIVNLNKFRKQKAKVERAKRAETNGRLHGRTNAERAQALLQRQRQKSLIDGARLEQNGDLSIDDEQE